MLDVKKIPPHIGYYLAGFADGEGCFMVVFRPRQDYKLPWKVSVCFNVSNTDRVIIYLFKRHFKCGTVRQRRDGVYYYEVNNLNALRDNVIPFFEKFKFLSSQKKKDFSLFKKIVTLMLEGKHLTHDGIIQILTLRRKLNRDRTKRKYSDEEVLRRLKEGILRGHTPGATRARPRNGGAPPARG